MYRSLRYLAVIFVMAPAMVIGRQATEVPSQPTPSPAPCPNSGVAIVIPNVRTIVVPHIRTNLQPNVTIQPEAVAVYDAEKRKTFEKTYKVNSSDVLNISNKFGRVHVNTWNKNEIKVKVDMIARAGSESKVNEMLSRMKIEEAK